MEITAYIHKVVQWIIVITLTGTFSYGHNDNQPELKLVQLVYRHGDRSPLVNYPTDPHDMSEWLEEGAQGNDQLTYIGRQQIYELGRFLRSRYIENGFLDEHYNRSQLYVQSSSTDRTLTSAYFNLAGLYPPWDNYKLCEKCTHVNWQPIPVQSVPYDDDGLLNVESICPYADVLYMNELLTDDYQKTLQMHMDLIQFAGDIMGMRPFGTVTEMLLFWIAVDGLLAESAHNFTMPEWTHTQWTIGFKTKSVYDWLEELCLWNLQFRYSRPPQRVRLRGGPLLKQMRENMHGFIEQAAVPRVHMFSTHDLTMVSFLNALNAANDLQPPYASVIILELYSIEYKQTYAVKLLFRNDTTAEPYILNIPGCESKKDGLCPYDRFLALTQSMVPDDWRKECQLQIPQNIQSKTVSAGATTGMSVGVAVTVAAVVVIIIAFVIANRKKFAYKTIP